MKPRKIAELGLLVSLALIFGWIEHLLPLMPSVPGVKLGLGNIIVIIALYRWSWREAALVSAAKVLLSALLFGSISGLVYSLSGALLSLAVMLLLYRSSLCSEIGVSAAGGAAHVCAQLSAAILITGTFQLWRMLPLLLVSGTLSGALNGFLVMLLLKRLKKIRME